MSIYPENPEINDVFNNRQWNGNAWVALNNPLSTEYIIDSVFDAHTSASANVHGILNSASIVYTNDARLSDQRTPLDNSVTSAKLVDGTILDSDISASANISQSKIVNLITDLAAKSPSASPTFTGTVTLPSTTSVGNVSSTEIGYLDNVTSAIQTQLDAKAAIANVTSLASPVTNRNLIYNGAMQVAQRGTSTASITTNGYYTADRWQVSITSLGTWTQTLETDAPTGSGFRNSLKMLCTTANAAPSAGNRLEIRQTLEGQDLQRIRKGTSSAQQVTMSFWVKSNVTGTYIAELRNEDGTANQVSASYTINASGTWEKKTVTFPADISGSSFDNDNGISLRVNWWLGAGGSFTSGTLGTTWHTTAANRAVGQTNLAAATNNYWQITGVQLEVGDTATEFEFKTFGQELLECQRYFKRFAQSVGFGAAQNATIVDAYVIHSPHFRAGPSSVTVNNIGVYFTNNGGATGYTSGTWSLINPTPSTSRIRYTHGSNVFTGGDVWEVASPGSGYIDLSAEL
jgi:hypothetical protein